MVSNPYKFSWNLIHRYSRKYAIFFLVANCSTFPSENLLGNSVGPLHSSLKEQSPWFPLFPFWIEASVQHCSLQLLVGFCTRVPKGNRLCFPPSPQFPGRRCFIVLIRKLIQLSQYRRNHCGVSTINPPTVPSRATRHSPRCKYAPQFSVGPVFSFPTRNMLHSYI